MTESQINDACCGVKWCQFEMPIGKCQGGGMLSAPKEKTEKRIFTQKGKAKDRAEFPEGVGSFSCKIKNCTKKRGMLSAKNGEGRKYTHKIKQKKIGRNFPSGKVHG